MSTVTERLNWYSRRIEKPYENEGQILINVYSPILSRGLEQEEYITETVKTQALSLILDFYGKEQNNTSNLLASTQLYNVFFPTRQLSNPILQIAISNQSIDDATDATGDTEGYLVKNLIAQSQIEKFTKDTTTLFRVYQQQLKFFNGAITPKINFLDLSDKIALFFTNLKDFVSFNGYDVSEYQKVGVKFSSEYMVQSVILQKTDRNKIINIPLVNGVKFYFETKKEGSNVYVNELVSNMEQILFDRQMKVNWTQFLKNYLSDSGIEVNFYGKPSTETEASALEKSAESRPWGILAVENEEARSISEAINNRAKQEKAFAEAMKDMAGQGDDIRAVGETLQKRLEQIVKKIENITGEVDKVVGILNQYNITTLIEAALECLLFKQGFNGSIPDFMPGINPFKPAPPKFDFRLPPIPTKFPIISINKTLQVQVRENLKKAGLSAIMSLIETFAGIIKELCLKDANEGPSQPAQDIIGDFLNPLEGPNPLYECYTDFGFSVNVPEYFEPPIGHVGLTDSSVLEAYLTEFAPLITPRELCDLFNGIASAEVLQVADNLIITTWTELRQNFSDTEAIQSFFTCLGNLVDPSYCEGVYNDITPVLPNIDPCTIEDIQPYQDIVELLKEVDDLLPDMSCGAGVVPPLAEIESYNNSVTGLINSVVSAIQQIFVNDLGNFKSTVVIPKPLESSDQARLEELEELLKFLTLPEEPERPPGTKDFLENMIPDIAKEAASDFQNIHNALTVQARNSTQDNIKEILARQEFLVAPGTRTFYETIEENFDAGGSSRLFETDYADLFQSVRYYSFSTELKLQSSLILNGLGRDVVFSMQPLNALDIFSLPLSYGEQTEKEELLDIPLGAQTLPARAVRANNANNFSEQIFSFLNTVSTTPTDEESLASLEEVTLTKLYPHFYFGLINSLAYKISTTDLFEAKKFNALNLFPRLCENGDMGNVDLLDVNSIKQSALQEFVDNSCIDREYELGPVRDAGILAIIELYMQVLIVDLILKNIFITSKFGIDYLANAEEVLDELIGQVTTSFAPGAKALSSEYNKLPRIVRRGSAMVVKKVIDRATEPHTPAFAFPISGEPTETQVNFIEANKENIPGISLDNREMQNIAIQYLFEKRLLNTRDKIEDFFGVKGNSVIETYLHNGIQFTDMKQMALFSPLVGSSLANINYFTKYNYIDNGEDTYNTYIAASATNKNKVAFADSLAEQKILKESQAFVKYGTFVAEKYFEIEYSPSGFGGLDPVAQSLQPEIEAQLNELVPLGSNNLSIVAENPPIQPNERYLMSHEFFITIMNAILASREFRENLKNNKIQTFLRGYNFFSTHYPIHPQYPISLRTDIELFDSEWDDSSPLKLSDYKLVRDWWQAIREEGLDILNSDAPGENPVYFDLYQPLNNENSILKNWSKTNSDQVKQYTVGPGFTYTYSYNNTVAITTSVAHAIWKAAEDNFHTNKRYLFNTKLFQGMEIFGYDDFGNEVLDEYAEKYVHEERESPGVHDFVSYVVAESKNFAVVISTPYEHSIPTVSVNNSKIFYIGFKRKLSNGEIPSGAGTMYSTIDFYDTSPNSLAEGIQRGVYDEMVRLFEIYENEEALRSYAGVMPSNNQTTKGFGIAPMEGFDISLMNSPSSEEEESQTSAISLFFQNVFPQILMKTRAVYVTPEDEGLASVIDGAIDDDNKIKSLNTFYKIDSNSNSRHVATDYEASININEHLTNDEKLKLLTTRGPVGYFTSLFENKKSELISQMATSMESLLGSDASINLPGILRYLYITGEIKTYYDLFVSTDIFSDTKSALVLALQAAFDQEESDCDVSALENTLLNGANRALTPLAGLGNSFLNKMLKETPKHILKGIVELIEPHVIISKMIKDVSRQAFQHIRSAQDMGEQIQQMIESGANSAPAGSLGLGGQSPDCAPSGFGVDADINLAQLQANLPDIPNLEEILAAIQGEIDKGFPEGFPNVLKPSATEKDGISLEGTVPFVAAIPPITPFGVIYLLLRLSEFGKQEIEVDCE